MDPTTNELSEPVNALGVPTVIFEEDQSTPFELRIIVLEPHAYQLGELAGIAEYTTEVVVKRGVSGPVCERIGVQLDPSKLYCKVSNWSIFTPQATQPDLTFGVLRIVSVMGKS